MSGLITIAFPKAETPPVILGYIKVQWVLKKLKTYASYLSTFILQLLGRIVKKVDRA